MCFSRTDEHHLVGGLVYSRGSATLHEWTMGARRIPFGPLHGPSISPVPDSGALNSSARRYSTVLSIYILNNHISRRSHREMATASYAHDDLLVPVYTAGAAGCSQALGRIARQLSASGRWSVCGPPARRLCLPQNDALGAPRSRVRVAHTSRGRARSCRSPG